MVYNKNLEVVREDSNNMAKYDYLIVGSGLFGACFAYKAKAAEKTHQTPSASSSGQVKTAETSFQPSYN